jgi:hypothetical protein
MTGGDRESFCVPRTCAILEPQSAIEAIKRVASLVTHVIEISINEDLYFAQVTGRPSVLRRGFSLAFFPEMEGLPEDREVITLSCQ